MTKKVVFQVANSEECKRGPSENKAVTANYGYCGLQPRSSLGLIFQTRKEAKVRPECSGGHNVKKAQKMEGENRAQACPYACKIEKCYLTSVASELLGEMAYRTVAVFPHCTPTVFIGAGSRSKELPRLPSSLPPWIQ